MPNEYDPELFDRIRNTLPNHATDRQAWLIRCARELSGMDREQLAKLAGVSRKEIMWLENGWLYPNEQEVIDKVNDALVALYRSYLRNQTGKESASKASSNRFSTLDKLVNFAKKNLAQISPKIA